MRALMDSGRRLFSSSTKTDDLPQLIKNTSLKIETSDWYFGRRYGACKTGFVYAIIYRIFGQLYDEVRYKHGNCGHGQATTCHTFGERHHQWGTPKTELLRTRH